MLFRKPILRRVSVVHSKRLTVVTLHGEDVGDRGAIRSRRGVGGRHPGGGGGTPSTTPATSCLCRHLCSVSSLLSSSHSHTVTNSPPPTPSVYHPSLLPYPRTTSAITHSHPSLYSVPLVFPTVAATTGCGIDWPSCPSSERSGRSNIRTATHRRLLHLHRHLHLLLASTSFILFIFFPPLFSSDVEYNIQIAERCFTLLLTMMQ